MASHKRTSSTAENTTQPPVAKRADLNAIANPFWGQSQGFRVYVVTEEMLSGDYPGESQLSIMKILVTLEDANNCVRRLTRAYHTDYNGPPESSEFGTDEHGRVWWDGVIGEGEGVNIRIEEHVIHGPGSEQVVEWPEDAEAGSQTVSEEEGEEEEEEGGEEGEEGEE